MVQPYALACQQQPYPAIAKPPPVRRNGAHPYPDGRIIGAPRPVSHHRTCRDTADVTDLLKQLHRIVNAAILTADVGGDQAEGLIFDLGRLDLERLRDEFATRVSHKATAIQDIRDLVEKKLAQMLARNPMRMDHQIKYEEIVAAYNAEKDRTSIEATFGELLHLVATLDEEQMRGACEGLSEDELAILDRINKDGLDKTVRERIKLASKALLASLRTRLGELDRFWEKGADESRRAGLHHGRGVYKPPHAPVHGGGKAAHRQQRVRPRLAASDGR